MNKPILTFLLMFITLTSLTQAKADIIEKEISFPNNLGAATLYTNSAQKRAKAAVIVVHEWWGLNQYAKNRAKMLAEEGYTAIAVDIYGHGKVAEHPKDAKGFMDAALANPDKISARFNAAKDVLSKQEYVDAKRLYAIGYCFGGAVVLNQARLGNDLAGVASFHGSLGTKVETKPGDITAKILVAHGGSDPFVPAEQVTGFIQEMLNTGAHFQFLNYPKAKHSFTNPEASKKGKQYDLPLVYDEKADKESWAALLSFIRN